MSFRKSWGKSQVLATSFLSGAVLEKEISDIESMSMSILIEFIHLFLLTKIINANALKILKFAFSFKLILFLTFKWMRCFLFSWGKWLFAGNKRKEENLLKRTACEECAIIWYEQTNKLNEWANEEFIWLQFAKFPEGGEGTGKIHTVVIHKRVTSNEPEVTVFVPYQTVL